MWCLRFVDILAEGARAEEAQQPNVLFKRHVRAVVSYLRHLEKVDAQAREYVNHLARKGPGISRALQGPIGTVDDLGPDEQVSNILRTAETYFDQVAPAAAHPPQADGRAVASEDPLPLAGNELLPPEDFARIRASTGSVRQHGCSALE
ncbi:MAG: hypothetical protein ACM3ML_05085 [Micromonosporaceae bacterium]